MPHSVSAKCFSPAGNQPTRGASKHSTIASKLKTETMYIALQQHQSDKGINYEVPAVKPKRLLMIKPADIVRNVQDDYNLLKKEIGSSIASCFLNSFSDENRANRALKMYQLRLSPDEKRMRWQEAKAKHKLFTQNSGITTSRHHGNFN